MSMLRFLTTGTAKGKHPARPPPTDGPIKLKLIVPNWGVMYLPAPELQADGSDSTEPRDDHPLRGELEVTLPVGGAKRCKSVRVGLRTMITLDMGAGRRFEEDVLFERKVEIISSTADGIWLNEGVQRFDFTIIVPANLASHDWHTNGVIAHVLYAEVEGLPDPNDWGIHKSASTSSLFGLRKASRSASRPGSRGASPTASPPLSPSLTPRTGRSLSRTSFAIPSGSTTPPLSSVAVETHCGANLDAALSNLAIAAPRAVPARRGSPAPTSTPTSPRSGSPVASPRSSSQAPMGGGTRPNPAHIAGAHSLSITRQEDVVLPRVPSYDDSMATLRENDGQTPDWIMGTHTTRRNCMIVYNPNVSGGTNELSERANGFVPGLGAWSWQMGTDVWCIGALLSLNVKFTNLTPLTTVFSVSLLLNQTHSVVSPRDVGGDDKHASTRTFTILSRGKRPAEGHYYPDKSHAALWRGKGAGGEDDDALGELEVDAKARMPNDNVARPSTVPGVVTPITVSHTFTLEIAFSVWGEDDLGNKMDKPGYGGLRVMRVSRPVLVPSCCLVPAVLDLPPYESHGKDAVPGPSEDFPSGLPGWEWCACGWQIGELEARMRQSVFAQQAEANAAAERAGLVTARSSVSDDGAKLANERGRQSSR